MGWSFSGTLRTVPSSRAHPWRRGWIKVCSKLSSSRLNRASVAGVLMPLSSRYSLITAPAAASLAMSASETGASDNTMVTVGVRWVSFQPGCGSYACMKNQKLQSENVWQMNVQTKAKSATNENKSQLKLRNGEATNSCHVCGKLLEWLFPVSVDRSSSPAGAVYSSSALLAEEASNSVISDESSLLSELESLPKLKHFRHRLAPSCSLAVLKNVRLP